MRYDFEIIVKKKKKKKKKKTKHNLKVLSLLYPKRRRFSEFNFIYIKGMRMQLLTTSACTDSD